MNSINLLLILSTIVASVVCISVPLDKNIFHTFIIDRCFNETYDRKPLTLGQNYPVGLSVENLISLIEKVESKLPQLNAQQIVIILLKRFHIDGLKLIGLSNMVSNIEMKHKRITEELMQSSAGSAVGGIDFPEDALTEDEKCALFFTLSHSVNETARHDEDIQHTYHKQVHHSRAPTKPVIKTVNSTTTTKNVTQAVQSGFLTNPQTNKSVAQPVKPQPVIADSGKTLESKQKSRIDSDENEENNKRVKRAPQTLVMSPNTLRLTRRPREIGVASFRNDKTTAIAMNRVLLGTAVGLLAPPVRTNRELIKAMSTIDTQNIPDGQIDPLIAVTLSDLLGIDAGAGLTTPTAEVLFGASGEWNSTACQTRYKLTSNGTLGTLAELRGGLDGWNIGRKLPTLIQQNPKITLSQILRQYYSPRGLAPDSGVCNRNYGLVGELQNKVQKEAENYIRVWNGVFYEGSYFDNQLTGFIAQTWQEFYRNLNKAGDRTNDQNDFCNPPIGTDIKGAPCESLADVFFMLDNAPAQDVGNTEQIAIITQVVKSLNLGRNAGSVTVLVNSQGSSNPSIVDDNNVQLNIPLYALVYNTTSSQCASCRAAYYDNSALSLNDRPLIMELVNRTLMEYELKKVDLPGAPSKSFIWFDYGNLKPIPTDKENKRRYEDLKWRLKFEHRDVTFFMASTNKDNVKDLLRRQEDFIQIGQGLDTAIQQANGLIDKICQTPQVFQHNECRIKKSEDKVYEGYLTPGYKQYWAIYPEYFIKSYTIDLKFKAEKARIKVCYKREMNPENNERDCDEARDDGGELAFQIKNPCKGRTFETCPPIYFTISLTAQSAQQISGNTDCNDPRCRSIDQVKWSFTHSGVSCNLSSNLLPNWTFQLICFILFLTVFCINGKRN